MTRTDWLVLIAGVICGALFFFTWQWYWGTISFVLLVAVLPWPGVDDPST